ncbi:MAG: threonine--tRNA ligase [Candidatus Aenigmarchaeota archaeon]|nr:threonine--tRNA ligase [Candidatus Aenigmarchaeota archaeon]
MKILTMHSDYLEFEPKKKAIPSAEEWSAGKRRIEECLVVFTAVEKGDEKDAVQSARNLATEVKKVADDVKTENIVLYPYAHLSSELASASAALRILKAAEKNLSDIGFMVERAPFGWYKAFEIKCKGHPLSELSREFGPERVEELVSDALKEEKETKSYWHIMTPDGRMTEITVEGSKVFGFEFSKFKNLEKFARYEISKVREVNEEPPHAKLMRRLEIADYESGSDPGNLKFYPKGRLIKSLLEQWITGRVIDYGGMEVETPIMYDFEHPALADYLQRFPARQYVVESAKKKFFLRFSACFGQFLMKSQAMISYRNLPLKMYELSKSFRLEKAGELVGLRRLRAFTMPDMHTLCKDMEQAKEEFRSQFKLCMDAMKDIAINDYEVAIRFTKDFYEQNKEFISGLVKIAKKPVLIEMWDRRFAYFVLKFEFNIVDSTDKASALPTVQIDVENAERYGIEFMDSDNKKKKPIILHASHSGAIERVIYALLEKAYIEQKAGSNPCLPMWLSPTQVRICPLSDKFLKDAEKVAEVIEKSSVRVDVDDRSEPISKKIRDAEMEWVNAIVVIGEKEKKSKKLAVRFRETGKVKQMKLSELVKQIKEETHGFPFKKLTLPKYLSKRPIFVG